MPSQPLETTESSETLLLTPDEFKRLATRIQGRVNRMRLIRRVATRFNLIVFGTIILLYWWRNTAIVGLPMFSALCCTELSIYILWRSISRDKFIAKRLVSFVENTQDATLLGAIINLQETAGRLSAPVRANEWNEVCWATSNAVERLLPLLQIEDAETLTTHQRAMLRTKLFPYSWINVVLEGNLNCSLSLLHILEQIGDKRDLPDIWRLLKQKSIPDQTRIAASRCVEAIRERIAREADKDVLLRPEHKPETIDTLLRPSKERKDTPPQHLLRASAGEEEQEHGLQ